MIPDWASGTPPHGGARNCAGAASATSACWPPWGRFRARSSCPPESRVVAYARRPDPHRLRPDHFAALHDRADGGSAASCTGTETVLEVGAGCGYAAAVLGMLAARVVTVEIIPALAALAQRKPAPHRPRRQRHGGGRRRLAAAIRALAPYDGDLGGGGRARDPAGAARPTGRSRPPGDSGRRGRRSGTARAVRSATATSTTAWPRCAASSRCAAAEGWE